MEIENKEKIKKKKRLKPFVKVLLFILSLAIILFVLYKQNFFSSAKILFQKKYSDIKITINKIIPHKNKESDSQVDEASTPEKDFLSVFKKRLPSQNISLSSSTLMPNGDMKIFLKNTKEEVGYLYVNTKDNVEEVWTTFASILISDKFKNLLDNNLSKLNYIDLRFKNKVFYKFDQENSLAASSSLISESVSNIDTASTSSSTNTN